MDCCCCGWKGRLKGEGGVDAGTMRDFGIDEEGEVCASLLLG